METRVALLKHNHLPDWSLSANKGEDYLLFRALVFVCVCTEFRLQNAVVNHTMLLSTSKGRMATEVSESSIHWLLKTHQGRDQPNNAIRPCDWRKLPRYHLPNLPRYSSVFAKVAAFSSFVTNAASVIIKRTSKPALWSFLLPFLLSSSLINENIFYAINWFHILKISYPHFLHRASDSKADSVIRKWIVMW